MTGLALMLRPTDSGWAVRLSNGQELVRYSGWFSRRLAVRYLERYAEQIRRTQMPRTPDQTESRTLLYAMSTNVKPIGT
jgi:hypothetical protein